ncbi:MAG: hypothetical protein IKO49_06335 [Bacilli bacterium]|nr:hypothetical protein [Bacilli bacterium]
MLRKYKVLIYLGFLFLIIVLTFTATWIFLSKVNGDTNIYQYGEQLTNKLYKYNKNIFYYGPKDEASKEINYNNSIIRKDDMGIYKVVIALNDEENTLMKNNYCFYKNYFYLISKDIIVFDISRDKPELTKKVYEGYFTGNANVSHIYGVKKGWIYIKVKLFKETENRNWYEDRYFKIKYDTNQVYEIPQKLLPEFK